MPLFGHGAHSKCSVKWCLKCIVSLFLDSRTAAWPSIYFLNGFSSGKSLKLQTRCICCLKMVWGWKSLEVSKTKWKCSSEMFVILLSRQGLWKRELPEVLKNGTAVPPPGEGAYVQLRNHLNWLELRWCKVGGGWERVSPRLTPASVSAY